MVVLPRARRRDYVLLRHLTGAGDVMGDEGEIIWIDASLPATLFDGSKSINCPTVQEAVIEWNHLPSTRKGAATITVEGRVFTAAEIGRLHNSKRRA